MHLGAPEHKGVELKYRALMVHKIGPEHVSGRTEEAAGSPAGGCEKFFSSWTGTVLSRFYNKILVSFIEYAQTLS